MDELLAGLRGLAPLLLANHDLAVWRDVDEPLPSQASKQIVVVLNVATRKRDGFFSCLYRKPQVQVEVYDFVGRQSLKQISRIERQAIAKFFAIEKPRLSLMRAASLSPGEDVMPNSLQLSIKTVIDIALDRPVSCERISPDFMGRINSMIRRGAISSVEDSSSTIRGGAMTLHEATHDRDTLPSDGQAMADIAPVPSTSGGLGVRPGPSGLASASPVVVHPEV